MTQPSHLLILDLEATCSNDRSIPPPEMETIEIGAVMVDRATMQPVDEFQTYIRPVRHPQLTAFCAELTSILQEDVDGAPAFPEAIAALRAWMVPFGTVLFCSWGDYDRKQLEQDCAQHGLPYPMAEHLNLKVAFAEARGHKKKGVAGALKTVGLEFQGTHHRGIDDARNIARLATYVFEPAS